MAQILRIHSDNPQQRLLNQAAALLRTGGTIVYPTDSGYALGCLLENRVALDKIKKIRRLDDTHNFTLVCRDLSELASFARVGNHIFRLLKKNTPGAYTFILVGTKEVPRRVLSAKRKTIGLRIPNHKICMGLLEALGEPLMSTSLILPAQEDAEFDPQVIEQKIGRQVDLIIDGGCLGAQPTTVVDLTQDVPEIIRYGAGDPSVFIH